MFNLLNFFNVFTYPVNNKVIHHKTTAVHDERLCDDQLNGQKSGETNVLCACMKCVSTCALSASCMYTLAMGIYIVTHMTLAHKCTQKTTYPLYLCFYPALEVFGNLRQLALVVDTDAHQNTVSRRREDKKMQQCG